MNLSLEELQTEAKKLKIFRWQEMDRQELEAAIQTAEEEAKDADEPLKEAVESIEESDK